MPEQNKVISYNNLKIVSPYEIIELKELRIEKKINEHSLIHITGMIPEDKKDSYIEKSSAKDNIKVVEIRDGKEVKTLFNGLVTSISIKHCMNVYYIALEGISYTFELDIKRKNRSFQNPELLYKNLINTVLAEYDKADFIDNATKDKKTERFILQYDETDWRLIKRLASQIGAVVIPDDTSLSLKLIIVSRSKFAK